jgi:hypothetical protein
MTQLPTERWTHVAVVHKGDTVSVFCDGEPATDAPIQLPLYMRRPCRPRLCTIVQRVESPHPYPNSMSETWTVSIPGATAIRVSFDPRTKYVWVGVCVCSFIKE